MPARENLVDLIQAWSKPWSIFVRLSRFSLQKRNCIVLFLLQRRFRLNKPWSALVQISFFGSHSRFAKIRQSLSRSNTNIFGNTVRIQVHQLWAIYLSKNFAKKFWASIWSIKPIESQIPPPVLISDASHKFCKLFTFLNFCVHPGVCDQVQIIVFYFKQPKRHSTLVWLPRRLLSIASPPPPLLVLFYFTFQHYRSLPFAPVGFCCSGCLLFFSKPAQLALLAWRPGPPWFYKHTTLLDRERERERDCKCSQITSNSFSSNNDHRFQSSVDFLCEILIFSTYIKIIVFFVNNSVYKFLLTPFSLSLFLSLFLIRSWLFV